MHDLPSLHTKPESTPGLSKKVHVVAAVQSAPSLSFPLGSHVLSHPTVPSWSEASPVNELSMHDVLSLHYQPVKPYKKSTKEQVGAGVLQSAPSLSFPFGSHVLSQPSLLSSSMDIPEKSISLHNLPSLHTQPDSMPGASKKVHVAVSVQSAPSLSFPLGSQALLHPSVPSWSVASPVNGLSMQEVLSLHYQPVKPYKSTKEQVVTGIVHSAPSLSLLLGSHVLSHPSVPSWSVDTPVAGLRMQDLSSLHYQPVKPCKSKKEQVAEPSSYSHAAPSLSFPLESHVLSHPSVPSWSVLTPVVGLRMQDLSSLHYQPVKPYKSKKEQVTEPSSYSHSAPSLSLLLGSHVLSHPSVPSWSVVTPVAGLSLQDFLSLHYQPA